MRQNKFYLWLNIIVVILLSTAISPAQVHVAVTEFKNESDLALLDAWEKSMPDLLSAELSRHNDIVVLERQKLASVFKEQQLALGGFVGDSALVQQIGNLAGAEVILSGSIYKFRKKYRIDVKIIRVKTTEVRTEKAEAPDSRHLNKMITMLANNIHYRLTGQGKYLTEISISKFPAGYFLAGGAAFLGGALLANSQYRSNYQKYHDATDLADFNSYYDKANNAHKLTQALAAVSLSALSGAIYCWIRNRTSGTIRAQSEEEEQIHPAVGMNLNHEVYIGVRIHF